MEKAIPDFEAIYGHNFEAEYESRVLVANVPPGVRDEKEAEVYARGCLWARNEQAKVTAEFAEQIEPVERYLEDLKRRRDRKLAQIEDRYLYFEESLKAFASEILSPEKGKPASRTLTSGVTVKIQRGREVVEIEDEEAFCEEWLEDSGFVRVKKSADKKAVLEMLKSGMEVEGARLVTNEDTYSVEMPK